MLILIILVPRFFPLRSSSLEFHIYYFLNKSQRNVLLTHIIQTLHKPYTVVAHYIFSLLAPVSSFLCLYCYNFRSRITHFLGRVHFFSVIAAGKLPYAFAFAKVLTVNQRTRYRSAQCLR